MSCVFLVTEERGKLHYVCNKILLRLSFLFKHCQLLQFPPFASDFSTTNKLIQINNSCLGCLSFSHLTQASATFILTSDSGQWNSSATLRASAAACWPSANLWSNLAF